MMRILILLFASLTTIISGSPTTTDLMWTKTNPAFRRPTTGPPHSLELTVREFDQLHLRCPEDKGEEHIIYRVSKAEYLGCRVANPRPEIVMLCGKDSRGAPLRLRTITFRPYSPTPGGLEFPPSTSHYFISTASTGNLYQRVGGGCSSHNLRLAIHVAPSEKPPSTIFPPLPPRFQQRVEESGPSLFKDQRPAVPSSQFLYYYTPRDLLRLPSRARSLNTPRRLGGPSAKTLGGPSARTARIAKNSSTISSFSFTILLYLLVLKSLLMG